MILTKSQAKIRENLRNFIRTILYEAYIEYRF